MAEGDIDVKDDEKETTETERDPPVAEDDDCQTDALPDFVGVAAVVLVLLAEVEVGKMKAEVVSTT